MQRTSILDCDTHFTDHTPERWSQVARELSLRDPPEVIEVDGQLRLRIGELVFPRPAGAGQGNPSGLGHLIGPGEEADRAAFMAAQRISAAVLQPGFVGLSFQAVADPGARAALAEAYNLLAARACAASALDLRWAILISAEDPELSLAEIARHAEDPRVVGAVVRPTARTSTARLGDAALTPVLHALAERELTLFVHGGTGCHQWSPLADAYADYALTHAFGHMAEQMIALTDLLTRPGGLPGALTVVLLESGTAWIPSLLERLALHDRKLGTGTPSVVERFRAHVAVAPAPDERYAAWSCAELGRTNILFGSDYPHWDSVRADDWFAAFGELCPPDVLRRNTLRFVPRLRDAA
ncbi:MAG TPA: amidohydrolase family protein [Kofleriaceae bacterium]|nr:amidohydrolase family protein [Kofleriaceae bacterium]